jgi:hypothetical protein
MFAVGRLLSLGPHHESTMVDGGTGWACQLFADARPAPGPLPLFVFHDQQVSIPRGWFRLTRQTVGRLAWHSADPDLRDFTVVAGVGSRVLSWNGSNAILRLVSKAFDRYEDNL